MEWSYTKIGFAIAGFLFGAVSLHEISNTISIQTNPGAYLLFCLLIGESIGLLLKGLDETMVK